MKGSLTEEENKTLSTLKGEYKQLNVNGAEFIHEYDAIQYLSQNLEKHKDNKFKITGNIEYNSWNGRNFRKFKIKTIEIVSSDTPSQLRATMDVFFTSESLDESSFEEEKGTLLMRTYLAMIIRQKRSIFSSAISHQCTKIGL